MIYYVNVLLVKNGVAKQGFETYKYESEIKCNIYRDGENLQKEIIEYYTNFFKEKEYDIDTVIISELYMSCDAIKLKYINEGRDVPSELDEIYKNSLKEKEEFINSPEEKKRNLIESMNRIELYLENIKQEVIKLDMLDSQEYLNYQDILNKYSIDPDREDTL